MKRPAHSTLPCSISPCRERKVKRANDSKHEVELLGEQQSISRLEAGKPEMNSFLNEFDIELLLRWSSPASFIAHVLWYEYQLSGSG